MSIAVKAAVLRELSAPFQVESLHLADPGVDEILVQVVSAGICHTDIKVSRGYAGVPLPVVLGHEGAGIVQQVGSNVSGLAPGDHVLLTFDSCGHCPPCLDQHPAYCDVSQALSFSCRRKGRKDPFAKEAELIHGFFFGQSCFASHALANPRNAVKIDKSLPLEKLGPLGCGFQTGAGIILNVLQPAPGQSLLVVGAGNVGLSAMMAARIAGMDPIVVLDNNAQRLTLATTLGATDIINPEQGHDPAKVLETITAGKGVHFALDTTNAPALIRLAFESLANRGTCVHSGGGGKDLTFPGSHLLHGRTVTGVIQGDSNPHDFLPALLKYYADGRFPLEQLLAFYPLAAINDAVADMTAGKVIKPVLTLPW